MKHKLKGLLLGVSSLVITTSLLVSPTTSFAKTYDIPAPVSESEQVDLLLDSNNVEGETSSYYEEELAKVAKKEKELNRLKKVYSGDKVTLEEETAKLADNIEKAKNQLTKIREQLKKKQNEVHTTQQNLIQLHRDIAATQKSLDAREAAFKERVKSMQQSKNPTGMLEVIFTSNNFGDMVSRVLSYSKIAKFDNDVIEEYLDLTKQLEDQKSQAETVLSGLQIKVSELETIQKEHVELKEELSGLKQQKEYETMLVGDVITDLEGNLVSLDKSRSNLKEKKGEAELLAKLEAQLAAERKKEKIAKKKELAKLAALEKRVADERDKASMAKKIYLSANAKKQLETELNIKEEIKEGKIFIMPAAGRFTSGFGPRVVFGEYGMHYGIDIANPVGTPIIASASGTVINAKWTGGYGNAVYLQHHIEGKDYITEYGHLSAIGVKVGDVVEQGEVIGLMGNTGRSTGPHLHFGLQENATHWDRVKQAVDPFKYLGKANSVNTLKSAQEDAKKKAEEEAKNDKDVKKTLKDAKDAADSANSAEDALKEYQEYLDKKKEERKNGKAKDAEKTLQTYEEYLDSQREKREKN